MDLRLARPRNRLYRRFFPYLGLISVLSLFASMTCYQIAKILRGTICTYSCTLMSAPSDSPPPSLLTCVCSCISVCHYVNSW